jgi:peptidoglycan/LPS O-acetylase OafA/YrhL
MTAIAPPKHRGDIDGLRAIAVIAVIVHHAFPALMPGGFVGVDVFFVISGFLITSILLRDLRSGTFSFATFYERRVRRLVPNLSLMLVFCSCVAWVLLLPADFANYSKSLFSTTVFASNIFFWRDSWYFAAPAQMKPLLHTWSLAIEEQYYLIFPFVLWILHRVAPRRIAISIVLGFVASLALGIWAATYTQAAGFFLLPPRAWELLLGSVLVIGIVPQTNSRRADGALAAAGLLAIVAATFLLDTSTPFPGAAALIPCIGTALVIYAGEASSDTVVCRLLSWRPLVVAGLMSYSLYLWHWPLLAFARYYYLSALTVQGTVFFTASSILLAYLAWRFVEQPVRTKVLIPRRRNLAIVFAATSGTLLVFAAAGNRTDGFGQRFEHVPIIDYDSVVADLGRDDSGKCFLPASRTASWDMAACTYAPAVQPVAPRRVFLIGDSFAAQFSGWLRTNFPGTIVELTSSACPPLFEFTHEIRPVWCGSINAMREDALRTQNFSDVFLGAWWEQTRNPGTMRALELTVHRILDSGVRRVTVLGSVPHFRDSPIDVLNRQRVFGRAFSDRLPTSVDPAYRAVFNRLAALPGVRVLNVDDWICRAGTCPLMLNGELLFIDGAAHLTRPGVRLFMNQAGMQ